MADDHNNENKNHNILVFDDYLGFYSSSNQDLYNVYHTNTLDPQKL